MFTYYVSQEYSEYPNFLGFLGSHLNWTSRCLAILKRSATRQPASAAAVFQNVSCHVWMQVVDRDKGQGEDLPDISGAFRAHENLLK